jgi:short-subunit dehydrogenase
MSVVIVGAGPNLGAAIARRFGREGMPVGLVSRNREKLELLTRDLGQEGITADFAPADIRDATALSSAIGSLAAVTTVIAPMLERGFGTILFTTGGAAINPNPARTGVGISFAGEVAYARMLHHDLRDQGIHVGHSAIGGRIAPDGDHEPDDVADVLWRHHTERGDFQIRLGFD